MVIESQVIGNMIDVATPWPSAVELIRPQGGIVSIDDTHHPMPMEMNDRLLK